MNNFLELFYRHKSIFLLQINLDKGEKGCFFSRRLINFHFQTFADGFCN